MVLISVKAIKQRIVSSHGRANVGDVVSRVKWRKIVKLPVNIAAANVEIVGTWRSVVERIRTNKAKEEAIANVEVREIWKKKRRRTEDRRLT